ncbi:tryptophan synthase subunit alpha [Agrococcus sediminis]|uniref:Tryptophan synthase subunit alpha n=1 Tax=Agrococcus sediminis TaxID=2599924 RepID=A0A5M8QH46_9MICO|nr:tryptophan synthase subunit alpha [Agrococcus sediminis]KAA6433692.1 tryptophan synthase subunit alpha [Agrococcus sediminis]
MTRKPAPHPSPRRHASLEVLRAEALDERSVLVDERLRAGEDPWEFMSELPSVDEIVVLLLRSERILPPGAVRPDHDVSDQVLRRIVEDYPPLAPTVWSMLSVVETERAWAPRVRRAG